MNAQIIIAALVGSIVLSVSAFVGGVKYEKGVVARRDLAAQQEQSKALVRAIDSRDAQRLKDEGIARKVSKDHASELDAIRAEFERNRASSEHSGLRITADACRAITPASAQSTSTSRPDAEPTATVALPAGVEQRLRELAREADEVNAIARGLQAWARANGFYGP